MVFEVYTVFIIGCFGIFDAHYANNYAFNIRMTVDLKEQTTLALKFNPRAPQGRAVEIEDSDVGGIEEIGNNFYVNKLIGKRKKIMSLVKLGVWLVIFALAIVLSLRSCGMI